MSFPTSHFGFARHAREADHETLQISFTTHDIRIVGRNLRELGPGLHKLTADWIREAPARYAPLSEKGRAFIERIEFNEISAATRSAGDGGE
jgi:hypothetical protein